MLPGAGVVVVWSGEKPRLDVHRVGAGGFVLGRDHADSADDRISRTHARVSVEDDHVVIVDLGSRNGTTVNGQHLAPGDGVSAPSLPAVVRTGNTVSVVVADATAYEGATIARCGSLACAGSLATALGVLEQTARAEEHVAFLGPFSIGRVLAHRYADIVGGERVVANLDVIQLVTLADRLKGAAPRTMILELSRPLTHPDRPELEAWLETDVRIVSIARGKESFGFMPEALTARLCARTVELPQYRFDELPTQVADRAKVHATFIAAMLVHLKRMNEETVMRYVDAVLRQREGKDIRGNHLDEYIANDRAMRDCQVAR